MGVVELGLRILEQRLDPLARLRSQPLAGDAAPVAMDQRTRSTALERPPQPTDLSYAQPQRLRHLHVRDLSSRCGFQQAQPPGLSESPQDGVHAPDTITAELTRTFLLRSYTGPRAPCPRGARALA